MPPSRYSTRTDLAVYAVAARYRRGQLAGDADGRDACEAAEDALRAQNVHAPDA